MTGSLHKKAALFVLLGVLLPVKVTVAETTLEGPLLLSPTARFQLSTDAPIDFQQTADRSLAVELIVKGFARAASQDLVTLPRGIKRSAGAASRDVSGAPTLPNFQMTTAIERAFGRETLFSTSAVGGSRCGSSSRVDVKSWATQEVPFANLSKSRLSMVEESGSASPEGQLNLARTYIFLGFGAEAALVLSGIDDVDKPLLLGLAQIVDGATPEVAELSGQAGCEGPWSLWSLLNARAGQETLPRDTSDLLSEFKGLPPHLRRSLGPALMARLQNPSDPDPARIILSEVQRLTETQSAQTSLADARQQPQASRLALFEPLLARPDLTGAQALELHFVESLERDAPLDWAKIEQAEAAARSTMGHPISNILVRLALEARIRNGDFLGVLARLKNANLTPTLNADARTDLSGDLLVAAADQADDQAFLRILSTLGDAAVDALSDESQILTLAERFAHMMEFGRVQRGLVALPDSNRKRILEARVLLESGEVEAALRKVLAVEDPPTDLLIAVFRSMERHEDLISVLIAEEDQSMAVVAALRAQSWEQVAALGAPQLAGVSSLGAERAVDLQSNRERLSRSRERRTAIAGALAELASIGG